MDFNLTAARSDVFQRLFADSIQRRSVKARPETPVEKPTGPRKNIEQDLMERAKSLKAKIHGKCAERWAKEREECSGVPSINPVSRRIAEQGGSSEKEQAAEVMMVANSLRGKKRPMSTSGVSSSVLDVKVNLSRHFLETSQGNAHNNPNVPISGINLDRIKEMMDAGKPITQEEPTSEFKYSTEDKNVFNRTMYWNAKRLEKIHKQREEKAMKETQGCTFKPETLHSKNKNVSVRNDIIEDAKSPERCYLSPSRSRVGYATGYDEKNFRDKAQPMLGYKDLAPEE